MKKKSPTFYFRQVTGISNSALSNLNVTPSFHSCKAFPPLGHVLGTRELHYSEAQNNKRMKEQMGH